jgi:glycosyltransferase involved in cell wall biosynthesis
VAVAICTYRRPAPLRQLLERLAEEAARSASVVRVGVAVVDDSPDREAGPVIDAFEGRFALGIARANTASGNISTARNAAIDTGLGLVGPGGWLCFIDDDCLPCEGWFDLLFGVRDATGAELVTGPLRDVAPPGAPAWLTEQPFLNLMEDHEDLAEPPYGATANTLIAADWLRAHPDVRFLPELGGIGGEDMVWFQSARAAGITHRYALYAEVVTHLPPSRTTYRYQLRSKLWWGNTMYVTNLAAGTSPDRLFLRGLKQVVRALTTPVRRAARRKPAHVRFAVAAACMGLGQMAGRFGVRLDHH